MRRAGGIRETRERVGGWSHEASRFRHSLKGRRWVRSGGGSGRIDVASVRAGASTKGTTAQGAGAEDAAESRRAAAGAAARAAQAEFLALDQGVPEGPGGECQDGLPDR